MTDATSPSGRHRRARARGLHGLVLDALGERIAGGSLAEGTVLDIDQLMEEFGVSRTVVRESLRVLAAKGLVGARPRYGTYVAERREWLLLDGDVMTWRTRGTLDRRLIRELGEVRAMIEPDAAAAAALKHTAEQAETLRHRFALLADADPADTDAHVEADIAFHLSLLDASGNELLSQFEVVMEPAMRARHMLAIARGTAPEFQELHRAVLDAVLARDPDGARDAMSALLNQAIGQVAPALDER